MSKVNKTYAGIDWMKFMMAFLVVAIHTHPFEGVADSVMLRLWHVFEEVAVPFFFIASGFFLFSKMLKQESKYNSLKVLKNYGQRTLRLYFYWTIIFLPITTWWFINNEIAFFKDLIGFILGIVLKGENYYSWPLWYLLSMIYSLAVIYFLVKKDKTTNFIIGVSIVFYSISVFLTYIVQNPCSNEMWNFLSELLSKTLGTGRLFSGMLYVMIGALFAQGKMRVSNKFCIFALPLSVLLELYSPPLLSSFTFVLLPVVMFKLALSIKVVKHAYFFRRASVVMYFTHMIVFFLYTLVFKEFRYFGWDAFLISSIVPILFTIIVLKTENKFPFLKHIF